MISNTNEKQIKETLETTLNTLYGKTLTTANDKEIYVAILNMTKNFLGDEKVFNKDKKVYYVSAEFLIGKLLSNNLINLGIYDYLEKILKDSGKELSKIEEIEPEPSLGNGGLGRLAACFLDSIATLGISGDGCGLNYHFGLFKQQFNNQEQTTLKNAWLENDTWLKDTGKKYPIKFGYGTVISEQKDIDVVGYNGGKNKLHLFDIPTLDENIVYDGIKFPEWDINKNLTLFLYPDDSTKQGELLRVYQQYFMVSSTAQLILSELKEKNIPLSEMADHVVIQINDTHPSMIIPEMINLLCENGIKFDEAVEIIKKTCAYTNHTILAEALEKWPVDYLETVCPQLVPTIKKLDEKAKKRFGNNPKLNIIDEDNKIHMAHMDIHYGFSVNGVAALHTEILKNSELNEFYKIYPEKFNNKTNGITFRRWLLSCNKELTNMLSKTIGENFKKDANHLEKLLNFKEDNIVLDEIDKIKYIKKMQLKDFMEYNQGIKLDPNSIFDIQIKRIHEYKRQQMNALFVISKYKEIKSGKIPTRPLTFIFAGKAAPAYKIAQDIIHLILTLREVIKNDPDVAPYMNVVMIENYNVSAAEKIIPACDISEQISLASKEASGTGNMKFMLNGAVTLGTDDGANVEIHQLVGDENIYIFGASSETVINIYKDNSYNSKDYYENNQQIKEIIDFIVSEETLSNGGNREKLERLKNELINKDWFKTLLDFEDYKKEKNKAFIDYEDRKSWKKKMLVNIAKSGYFSSDRTIFDYNRDIWKTK
ncbi:MAG: glycogen/starch/alpha-glucan phosphorylase [Bacilli bacterium]